MSSFSSLPEDCIANIISLTSPKDACRAEAVSQAFKSAAESNTVWDRFLPPDFEQNFSASNSPLVFSSKKELYFLLSDSGLLLHEGRLLFRLIKSSGKKCYMFCARELQIVWGDTPEHWGWTSLPESRFSEVAELLKASWLDIRRTFNSELLSPNTNYAAYLVFKLRDDNIMLDIPALAVVKKSTDVEENNARTVYIVPPTYERRGVGRLRMRMLQQQHARGDVGAQRTRDDGWMEIELGEIFVLQGDMFDVDCALFEHMDQYWKRGLLVEGIEVRPKDAL